MILAPFLHNQTSIIVQAELQHIQETIKTNFSPDKNPASYNYAHPIIRIMKSKSRFRALIIRTPIPCFFIFFDSNSIIRFLRATFGSKLRVFQTFSNSVLLHYSVLIRWTLAQWLFHRRDWEQEFRIFFKR